MPAEPAPQPWHLPLKFRGADFIKRIKRSNYKKFDQFRDETVRGSLERAFFDVAIHESWICETDSKRACNFRIIGGTENAATCWELGMNEFVAKPAQTKFRTKASMPELRLANEAPPTRAPINPGAAFESPAERKAHDNLIEEIGEAATVEIITVFVRDTATRLRQLRELDVLGDRVGIERQAHSLKSAAGVFGLDHLAGLARDLELRAEELTADSYGALVARIEVAFDEARNRLADLALPRSEPDVF